MCLQHGRDHGIILCLYAHKPYSTRVHQKPTSNGDDEAAADGVVAFVITTDGWLRGE